MRIKSIDICGFKSFVDRTVIHFGHDVVGIVGPNGCGKSNIVDAIRWCMGEQSAKHLRGRAMEDVLFNGSESRGPHGFAEVTMTFRNEDPEYAATLPEEYRAYPEIAVTRRLFRDGTSEYLLNMTPVRLRDVTDLFLGTGVGTKAYSIVEQGRIGQIVTARPQDRRMLIEEAAGITKFKLRKRLTERKLDAARQNLLRLSDIVAEMERNRNSLKRQAAKAERYAKYRDELDDLFLHDASHRFLEMLVTEKVRREAFQTTGERAGELRQHAAREQSALDAARVEAEEIERRSERAALEASQTENEIRAQAQEIHHNRERHAHLQERLAAAHLEQKQLDERVGILEAERHELEQRVRELANDESARAADTANEDASLAALVNGEAKAIDEVEGLKSEAAENKARAAALEGKLGALAQRIEETRVRRDRAAAERDTLTGEVANLAARRQALEASMAELAEGKRLTVAEHEALRDELEQLRRRAIETESTVDVAKNDLGLKRNRLRALEDLHRRFEGVGAGARALLSGAQTDAVLGLVADRVEAPEDLTAALAGLLGDRLQCVVVSGTAEGLELLGELRREERGRATVVPRSVGARRGDAVPEGTPGVLGMLVDRLSFAAEDAGFVRALVGNAVLTATGSDAARIALEHAGVTAVALDGTVARADGSISGGSGDEVAAAMVEHKREMHALTDEIAGLEAAVQERVAEHTAVRQRMTHVGTALDRAREGAHEGELAHVTAEKDLHRATGEMERARARLDALRTELAEADRIIEAAHAEDAAARADLAALKHRFEQGDQARARADENLAAWKERVAAQTALVTDRKVRLAQIREQAEAARESRQRQRAAMDDVRERSAKLDDEMTDIARSQGEAAARWSRALEAKSAAETAAQVARREDHEAHALLDQVRSSLQQKEADIRALRVELEAADEETRRHEMSLREIEINRGHLLESVREKYRVDLRRIIGDYHLRPAPDEEHRRRISELSQLMRRMGPVNLDAEREFIELEGRFQTHVEQQTDIQKAIENLERAIKIMNRDARRLFRETFDSVNALFKATFQELFRGGRAELVLTDPEDLLESGVDIIAQPPGKKLSNLELMSGGEKALTATAMIFAMFRHRPSPFCVLDEVDAPLDDANVGRYVDMIRAMTASSQFILITHIKATMARSDVLYGVTMGEPGVSRIVSVKVNDVEEKLGLRLERGRKERSEGGSSREHVA